MFKVRLDSEEFRNATVGRKQRSAVQQTLSAKSNLPRYLEEWMLAGTSRVGSAGLWRAGHVGFFGVAGPSDELQRRNTLAHLRQRRKWLVRLGLVPVGDR
jgi:hypothetical protein